MTLMIIGNKATSYPTSVSAWEVLNDNANSMATATATADKLQIYSVNLDSKWMLAVAEDGQGNGGRIRLKSR